MTLFTRFSRFLLIGSSLLLVLAGCGDDDPTGPAIIDIGSTWRLVESGIGNSVSGLAANDTLTVAVGDGGIIYSSTDGAEWTAQREYGPNDGLTDIAWFRNLFVAIGYNGTNISSTDGRIWAPGDPADQNLIALGRHDTLLLAIGEDSSIYRSVDGTTFSLHTRLDSTLLQDIVRTNIRWLACGSQKIWRSYDANNWTQQTSTFPPEETLVQVEYSDTLYFLLSREASTRTFRLYTSADADQWFYQSSFEAWYIRDLVWTGSELVAVGDGTNYHAGLPDGVVFSTTDYLNWTEQETEAPFALKTALVSDSSLMIAGSGGYILSGPTADSLKTQTSGADMTGVIWDGNRYVAVTAQGTVMLSDDGEVWEEHHSGVSNSLERLAFGSGGYVTIGGLGVPTDIYTSADAISWTRTHAYNDVFLKDVIRGGGQYLACGQYGTVYVSADGQSWSRQYVGDSVTLNCLVWDGARYLTASTNSVFTSSDGAAWTQLTVDSAAVTTPIISRMIFDGTNYVAVGNDYSNPAFPQGVVSISGNGVDWTVRSLGQAEKLLDIGLSGSRIIICGRDGELWSSNGTYAWTKLTSPTEHDLVDIATTDNRALIVGGRRTVLMAP